jgi:hypothetical protein
VTSHASPVFGPAKHTGNAQLPVLATHEPASLPQSASVTQTALVLAHFVHTFAPQSALEAHASPALGPVVQDAALHSEFSVHNPPAFKPPRQFF